MKKDFNPINEFIDDDIANLHHDKVLIGLSMVTIAKTLIEKIIYLVTMHVLLNSPVDIGYDIFMNIAMQFLFCM